jgi:hypothetical protein
LTCSTQGRLRTTHQGHQDYSKLSLGPLPRWVPGPTTRWVPETTRLMLHDIWWRGAQGLRWRSTRIGSYVCPDPYRELLDVHN